MYQSSSFYWHRNRWPTIIIQYVQLQGLEGIFRPILNECSILLVKIIINSKVNQLQYYVLFQKNMFRALGIYCKKYNL